MRSLPRLSLFSLAFGLGVLPLFEFEDRKMRLTKAQKREARTAAAIAANRQTLGMRRAAIRAARPVSAKPGELTLRPLIERTHPWDFAKLPEADWQREVRKAAPIN